MSTKTVICELCPKACRIPHGAAGDCRVRVNIEGKIVSTIYGRPSALHVDPIEKKPLNHFFPGSGIFSIATAGCNLHCKNCQNWQLSQRSGAEMEVRYKAPPEKIVEATERTGCKSIAYTYSEPIIFYEYVYDTAKLAIKKGIKNVLVTAGFVNPSPWRKLLKLIDACNIDLKYFDDSLYRKNSEGWLKPILDSLVICKEMDVWLEITHLLIPTLNDDMVKIRKMCKWMYKNLGADTPLHISRFHPQYKLRNLPATPGETLIRARNEAMDVGLKYVYIGNLHGHPAESTFCPKDGKLLIKRLGYVIAENNIIKGRCKFCKEKIAGRWHDEI
ncbi:AmmeMemoRadiSam system radical SAM enzyme [Candidatus Riflebacteria bacterium]